MVSQAADHPAPSENATDSALRALKTRPPGDDDWGLPAAAIFVLVAIPLAVLLFSLLSLAVYLAQRAPEAAPPAHRKRPARRRLRDKEH